MNQERIKPLLEKYKELEQSRENSRRRSMWKGIARSGRDQFRPTPKSDRNWKNGEVPLTVDIQNPTWAKIIGFDIQEYYFNPEVYVENYLKIMIYRFLNFQDDTFLTMDIPMWGTSILEGSFFNVEYFINNDQDPWISNKAVIATPDDLKKLPQINFKTSGIMPQLIRTYEGVCELCKDGFTVLFPEWNRGPFGVAVYIRGFEDLLVDMLTNQEFTDSVMRHITDSRKIWFEGLEKYLGHQIQKANLYNDEISCPILSPTLYMNRVFSYEQELCDFHKGLHYWHSCGNVSDLTNEIAKLHDLDLFNVGPWTSVLAAGNAFRDKAPLEICMNPQLDIIQGTRESMAKRLNDILEDCRESNVAGFGLKISALNASEKLDEVLSNIKLWIEIARIVSQSNRPIS